MEAAALRRSGSELDRSSGAALVRKLAMISRKLVGGIVDSQSNIVAD